MSEKFQYGTGRRKTATARTRLYAGSGNILVNGRPYQEYFNRKTLQMVVCQPLKLTNMEDKLEVRVNVCGGGTAGQAEAVGHGIDGSQVGVDAEGVADAFGIDAPVAVEQGTEEL